LTESDIQPEENGTAVVDLATAVGNPWRFRILIACSLEDTSPSGFVRDHGGEISNISRHFRRLADWGYLERVEERRGGPRRGGVEHFYRGARRAHLDTATSEGLPAILREDISNTLVSGLFERVRAATQAGTFDADVDRHLSWIALELNKECFNELSIWLDEILAKLPGLEEKAKAQMEVSGEEPFLATAALLSFRSPPGTRPRNPRDRGLPA
jgi:DNA-binding transcriptional ArsR family regulator